MEPGLARSHIGQPVANLDRVTAAEEEIRYTGRILRIDEIDDNKSVQESAIAVAVPDFDVVGFRPEGGADEFEVFGRFGAERGNPERGQDEGNAKETVFQPAWSHGWPPLRFR